MAGFLDDMLAGLGRSERRQCGSVYVRGLLATGGRKATATLAEHEPDGDVQAMQQFIAQSPWPWEPLRKRLGQRMAAELHPAAAYLVDDTGFPKKGSNSVGVARQYSGTLGKVGNCQVAVSLRYATNDAAVPLDFALYLPKEWLEPDRRRAAGIPEDVTFQTKWALALTLINRAREWGLPAGVVTADAGYGNVTEFRTSLAERKLLTKRGRRLYRQRSVLVEPVFGQVKEGQGFRRFMRRGLVVPTGRDEASLVATAHNLLKLWRSGKAPWGWARAQWN